MKRKVILSLLIPIALYLLCYSFVNLESIVSEYFRMYYNPRLTILFNAVQIVVWAVILRIAMALLRKPFYKGPIRICLPALISACILVLIFIINIIRMQVNMLFNGILNIITVFSILCIFQRKRD